MTREEAIDIVRKNYPHVGVSGSQFETALQNLIPELRESEDEKIRRTLVEYFGPKAQLDFVRGVPIQKIRDWLEKQKEQKPVDFPTTDEEVNEFLETHPKVEVPEKYKTPDFVFKPAEWSEEDADILNCCISSIEEAKENRYAYKETDGDTSYDREIDWLKSLRPVSKESLQPHWKPSEEQIATLEKWLKDKQFDGASRYVYPIFESLYEQLKKLM